jgi:hypothetical protein
MPPKLCDLRQFTRHIYTGCYPTLPFSAYPTTSNSSTFLHNPIKRLGNVEAGEAKNYQSSSDAAEPRQVAFSVLSRNPNVHTPQASYDIHGKDDRTKDGQLAEHIRGLLLSLVHSNVDLCEVVAVGARKDPVAVSV